MYTSVFKNITADTIILTPNRRLANHLQEKYNDYQLEQQKTIWITPDILPITSWLIRLWQTAQDSGQGEAKLLLTDYQEQLLWQDIIAEFSDNGKLLLPEQSATLAKQAWEIICHWQALSLIKANNQDSEAFQHWMNTYQKRSKHWLDNSRLPHYILQLLQKKLLPIPKQLYCIGFAKLTPIQQTLFNTLQQQNCIVQKFQVTKKFASKSYRVCFNNTINEIENMAIWCKQILEKTPEAKIGCVIPDLTTHRDKILTSFIEILTPSLLINEISNNHQLPFNISAGIALSHYPVINTAMTVLAMLQNEISITDLNYFIKSAFIGGAETEFIQRHQLEIRLLNSGKNFFEPHELKTYFKRTPKLAELWNTALKYSKTILKKRLAPSEWATQFEKILSIIGWPGERSLNSHEFQTVERFKLSLLALKQYNLITPKINFNLVLQQFRHINETTLFQPQSLNTAPIQILGTLEASGLPFNYLWVMGLDDRTWPSSPNPNPFIPIALQRLLDMPHASTEREWEFCQEITHLFLQSADNVIFSYASQQGDMQLKPSPLITQLPSIALNELLPISEKSLLESLHQPNELESIIDIQAAPILTAKKLRGGSQLFKLQAQCPFRSYAEIRLRANEIKSLRAITAIERGKILHSALQFFWNVVKSQENLAKLSEEELSTTIVAVITDALRQLQQNSTEFNKVEFNHLEQLRLIKLIKKWLQYELKREPFIVLAVEQRISTQIKHLEFDLVIDRIDELQDGSKVIIDYKTGIVSPQSWLGERPDEPQLPLYMTTSAEPIASLAFAQIRADGVSFKGFSETPDMLPNVKTLPDWQTQIQNWKTSIHTLAQEFMDGHAIPKPKYGKQTCQQCHLSSLCRIHEKAIVTEGEDNDFN